MQVLSTAGLIYSCRVLDAVPYLREVQARPLNLTPVDVDLLASAQVNGVKVGKDEIQKLNAKSCTDAFLFKWFAHNLGHFSGAVGPLSR